MTHITSLNWRLGQKVDEFKLNFLLLDCLETYVAWANFVLYLKNAFR